MPFSKLLNALGCRLDVLKAMVTHHPKQAELFTWGSSGNAFSEDRNVGGGNIHPKIKKNAFNSVITQFIDSEQNGVALNS